MVDLPSPMQTKIMKIDLSQISQKQASPRLPFAGNKLRSPKASHGSLLPNTKFSLTVPKFQESHFQSNPSLSLGVSPIASPKNCSIINQLSRKNKNPLLLDFMSQTKLSPVKPIQIKNEGLIDPGAMTAKRKTSHNEDFSNNIASSQAEMKLTKSKLLKLKLKALGSVEETSKPVTSSEANDEAEGELKEGDCVTMLGKVFQEEAMKLYSARSSRAHKPRHEKKKSDVPSIYSSRAKYEKTEPSPVINPLKGKVTFGHIRTGSVGLMTTRKDFGLSSHTQYNLSDKQMAIGHETNRRKPVRKNGDPEMLKCFESLRLNIRGDLLIEPRISFYQNFTIKKNASLRLENVETIKNICRGNVFSKKNM